MAARFLLDTDTCIFIRDKRPPRVLARFEQLQWGEAAISVVTYGELVFGVAKSSDRSRSEVSHREIVRTLSILPLPAPAGALYGELRASLAGSGQIIGGNDLWIAAHAMAEDLILVTNNEREFRRVRGLKIENWAR